MTDPSSHPLRTIRVSSIQGGLGHHCQSPLLRIRINDPPSDPLCPVQVTELRETFNQADGCWRPRETSGNRPSYLLYSVSQSPCPTEVTSPLRRIRQTH